MQKEIYKLTSEDFANLFRTAVDDIPESTRELIAKSNLKYQKFSSEERNQIILEILKRINSKELPIAGKERKTAWEKGWQENLKDFIENGQGLADLVPKYIRPNQPSRLYCDYIQPEDPIFGLKWFNIFRSWFFQKHLKDVDAIYEFGCGTGYNLAILAKLFPEKKLYGLDWVNSSVKLINLLAKKQGYNLKGYLFDMFSPNESLSFKDNSAVLTVHALEQLGPNFERFLNFLLKKSPSLCLNIEPIYELYDENNIIDYLAMRFHKRRKYLDGFLTRLKQLEKEGRVEILKVQRVLYGSCMYQDSYSYVIWRPKK